MKTHKTVKRAKPAAIVLFLKDELKQTRKSIELISKRQAFIANDIINYNGIKAIALELENYQYAKALSYECKKAEKQLELWTQLRLTTVRNYDKQVADLRKLREMYGVLRRLDDRPCAALGIAKMEINKITNKYLTPDWSN